MMFSPMVNDIKFEHNPKAQKGTVGEVLGADKVALCGAVVVWVVVAGEQVYLATLSHTGRRPKGGIKNVRGDSLSIWVDAKETRCS
jgi:hypothetical protein